MYDDSPFEKERQKIKTWWIVFVFGFLVFAFFAQSLYWRSVSYTGRVVKKYVRVSRSRRSHSRTYILRIETNKGKIYEQSVPSYIYSRINVGDWVKKKRGELYPKVVLSP